MVKKQTPTRRRRQPLSRRPTFIVIIILVIAVVGLVIAKLLLSYANHTETQKNSAKETTSSDTSQEITTDDTSTDTADQGDSFKTPVQNEGDNPNNSAEITGAITTASVADDVLRIRVSIDQYLTSGTCTLTLTAQDGGTTSQTAPVTDSASTSTCEGFDLPISDLSSGVFAIEIKVSSDDKTGIIDGEVNI